MSEVASWITVGFGLISMMTTAIWAVSKISRDTATLSQSIIHLDTNVNRLTKKIDHLDQRTNDHEGRIIRLEATTSRPGNGPSGPA